MQELITRLTSKAGISTEQAASVIDIIKEFVKEKFPMMAGAVDNLLSGQSKPGTASAGTASPGFMEKISDVIPGETGENIEDFV